MKNFLILLRIIERRLLMKYDKELYIDSGIYGLDEDIRNYNEKNFNI